MPYTVCALYHFTRLDKLEARREGLLRLMRKHGIKGTLLLAAEGINGTVAGSAQAIDILVSTLRSEPAFAALVTKESTASDMPFLRSKVKIKKEIVTMGVSDIDPSQHAGTYVKPEDWNALIDDPDVLVVDTRNDYEVGIGTFKGAMNPETETFREFPAFAEEKLAEAKQRKIAMFCTGGIRCEKSTAYLKKHGFDEVYHLQGGILKYLENVPAEDSCWEGECFVFDSRISVKHGLEEGQYDQCYACRRPITQEDMQHAHYVKGSSCHLCFDATTAGQKQRYADRQKQMELAERQGVVHMGGEVADMTQQQRQRKKTARQQHSK